MQKRIPVRLSIANIFNDVSRGLAVTAISGYQKFLSPHKGFSCAHRVLYGCESCSQYFKRVIAEDGMLTAIASAKGRFQECREANEIVKSRREKCRAQQNYYASRYRVSASTVAIASSDLDPAELPDIADSPEESENSNSKKLGGSQWGRKQRSQTNNGSEGGADNNCNNCADCTDGFSVMDCPDLNFPDLNCGNADCLSGLDCGGLDCGGSDCSGCGDCGSCN